MFLDSMALFLSYFLAARRLGSLYMLYKVALHRCFNFNQIFAVFPFIFPHCRLNDSGEVFLPLFLCLGPFIGPPPFC